MSSEDAMQEHAIDRLHATVRARKGADPAESYTAKLYAKGRAKIAQKLGEEAVECVIEAVGGDREKLADESADLLYHLCVLWADADLDPAEVWARLDTRAGTSGLAEKAAREE